DTCPRRPDLELLNRRSPKRIGSADERKAPIILEQVRQFSDRGGLTSTVDADDEGHGGRGASHERLVGGLEDAENLLLHQVSKAPLWPPPPLSCAAAPLGGGRPPFR